MSFLLQEAGNYPLENFAAKVVGSLSRTSNGGPAPSIPVRGSYPESCIAVHAYRMLCNQSITFSALIPIGKRFWRFMQDLVCELPRISITGTWMNESSRENGLYPRLVPYPSPAPPKPGEANLAALVDNQEGTAA